MTAADRNVNVGAVVIIDGQSIPLPAEVIDEYVGGAETSEQLLCTTDGSIIVQRTGQVYS